MIGALCGGLAPDRIEPPDHPRHRDKAHSALVLVLVAIFFIAFGLCGEESLLESVRAEEEGLEGDRTTNLKAVGLCCLAGGIRGLAVGYDSHLLADGINGEGIPWISRNLG